MTRRESDKEVVEFLKQFKDWSKTLLPYVLSAALGSLSFYYKTEGKLERLDDKISRLEASLAIHDSTHCHANFVSGNRMVHPGFHAAIEGEVQEGIRESDHRSSLRWKQFFQLNPSLVQPIFDFEK